MAGDEKKKTPAQELRERFAQEAAEAEVRTTIK